MDSLQPRNLLSAASSLAPIKAPAAGAQSLTGAASGPPCATGYKPFVPMMASKNAPLLHQHNPATASATASATAAAAAAVPPTAAGTAPSAAGPAQLLAPPRSFAFKPAAPPMRAPIASSAAAVSTSSAASAVASVGATKPAVPAADSAAPPAAIPVASRGPLSLPPSAAFRPLAAGTAINPLAASRTPSTTQSQ